MDAFEDIGEGHQQSRDGQNRAYASGGKEKTGEQKRERKAKKNPNEQNSGLRSGQPTPHPLLRPLQVLNCFHPLIKNSFSQ
jgi:hypothetical protein